MIGLLGLLACSGSPDDDATDARPTDSADTDTDTPPTGTTATTAETGTPTPPEGWVRHDWSDFADAEAVTVSIGSNPAGITLVLDVIRGGGHELWVHSGRWVQLMGDSDATDVFVPSIRAREGVTHVLARARCDRHAGTCPDPGAMKLVEIEVPDGWDGVTPWVERPVTPPDGISDGQSQLVPDGDELHVCNTVHELGDEVECRTRDARAGAWSAGLRVSEGGLGADDHPYAFVTSGGDRLVGYTTSQTGDRAVRLLLGPGTSVALGVDLDDGTTPLFSDWMTMAEADDGDLVAMWAMEPTPVRQLAVGRCDAGTLAGCATLGSWERSFIDPTTPGPQNHPNLAGAPGALLASWERTEPSGDKRIRFATVCDGGTTIVTDVDPEGSQSKIYGFPGMVYEPTTNTVHLAYVRDRGAGVEVVWASLYDPAGACP